MIEILSKRWWSLVLVLAANTMLATVEPAEDSQVVMTMRKPKYPTTPAATRNPALLGFGMLAIGSVAAYVLFLRKSGDGGDAS